MLSKDQDFKRLWLSSISADAGSALAMGAFGFIAVTLLSVSTFQLSILSAVSGIVAAIFIFTLGPTVDRRRKRPIMISADVARAIALLTIPIAAWLGWLTFTQLVIVAAVVQLTRMLFEAAANAHLKHLIEPEDRTEAFSKIGATFWIFNSVGPALGGALLQALGATITLVAESIGFLLSGFWVSRIKKPDPEPESKEKQHFLKESLAGLSYVTANRDLRLLYLNFVVFAAFMAWLAPLETALLLKVLDLPAWQYGIALAIPAVGGFLGSLLAKPSAKRWGEHKTMLGFGTLRSLPLFALPFSPLGVAGVALYAAVNFLLLMMVGGFQPAFQKYRMELIPDEYHSRIIMTFRLSALAAAPIAALLGGFLAQLYGVRVALFVGAVGILVSSFFLPRKGERDTTTPSLS